MAKWFEIILITPRVQQYPIYSHSELTTALMVSYYNNNNSNKVCQLYSIIIQVSIMSIGSANRIKSILIVYLLYLLQCGL